jgi:hypothetical protein
MTRALSAHWAATFGVTPTCEEARNEFCLRHVVPIGNVRIPLPTPKSVGHAVKRGSWSAPGPDGIAGAIWRQFAPLVTIEFYGVAKSIWEGELTPPDSNIALAAYIPKKGLARGDNGLQARPSEARPLMLKNADTKVFCRVLAFSLMPVLQNWCHQSQRGFLKDRMPGVGILDIDTAARCIAMCRRLGLIGLFDFSAAFPSISRLFIIAVMTAAHFPDWMLAMAAATWRGARVVNDRGETEYEMGDGVGQGCPSAAALFVIGINPLLVALSKLCELHECEIVSAYADDIAICVTSADRLQCVYDIFAQFKKAAALDLNMRKTVFVPITSGCADSAAIEVRATLSTTPWANALVDTYATLIGVRIGPVGCDSAFSAPLAKYAARVREIANLGLSMTQSIMLAQVLATPVLHHVGQFHPLPHMAGRTSLIAAQSLLHLPHHGFAALVLRNLPLVGLPDLGLADLAVKGIALSAARRFAVHARLCIERLTIAFSNSDLRPLAALRRMDNPPNEWFIPIGWSGPSFAAVLAQGMQNLTALGAQALKGPALCRAIEPLCSPSDFASELLRRLALWAPTVHCATLSVALVTDFLPTLTLADHRDKVAWLRTVQNAWCTRGRFSATYSTCLVCGAGVDRLQHIITCKPFWRPVFTLAGAAGGRGTLPRLLLSGESARLVGLGFRAHAALRGLPSFSASAWAEQVRASA